MQSTIRCVIGLVYAKFCRKTPYSMGISIVSCRFSLKPIQWMWENATFCTSLAAQGIWPWLAHWPGEKRRLVIPPALGCPGVRRQVIWGPGSPGMGQHWEPLGHLSWLPSGKHTKKLWKDPPCSMRKSTISTGPCSIAMLVYQRVPKID